MANFEKYYPKLKAFEGGYAVLPGDSGGCTNHGIAFNYNQEHIKDYNRDGVIDCEDVRLMPASEGKAIAKKAYWDKLQGDHIQTQEIAEMIMDWGFHNGVNFVIMKVQGILALPEDGVMGETTLKAINKANQKDLYEKIYKLREQTYIQGGSQYLQGFLNRLHSFPKTISPLNKKVAIISVLLLLGFIVLLYFYRKEVLSFYKTSVAKLKK